MADSVIPFANFKEQEQYLADRGLDRFTIEKLGLEIRTATWLHENGFPKVPGLSRGIVWRLRDPEGAATGKLGARVFYQQGIITNPDKPKFLPPKGQVPGVYFSPLNPKLEYGDKVYVCESYLKADICALLGFYAVGVSGCWGWSYKKQLNWDFALLPWSDLALKPIVCMDSNVNEDNHKLWLAARRLCAAMEVEHQVSGGIIVLPKPKGDKDWGLDDYYIKHGRDATQDYLHGDVEPLPSKVSDKLSLMAGKVVLIEQTAELARVKDGLLMKRNDFENFHYADWVVWNEDDKPIPVAKAYMKWPDRVVVNQLVYLPGQERLKVPEHYNLWEKSDCVPLAANTEYFTSWMQDCFSDPVAREFIYDWWAWQLQNMGGKLNTGLIIVGPPGIGKGWITAIMVKILGDHNVASVPLTVLEKHFNAEVATKQLFVVEETDEVGGSSQIVYNKLKDMITNPRLRLERKGVDAQMIDNVLNVFLTGNQVGIFKLDSADRRFMVAEADGPMANDLEYWEPRWEWLRTGGGAEAVYALLLRRDLARFNAKGMAPMTTAKKDMIEITHTSMELWIESLVSNPEDILIAGQAPVDGCVASAKELAWLYLEGKVQMQEVDRVIATKMNAALKNARVPVVNDGKKIKPTGGIPTTYFQIRQLPSPVHSWSAIVKDRLFWARLKETEMGQVASRPENGSQPTKY